MFEPEEFLEEVYKRIEQELQITLSLFNETEKLFDDATKSFKSIVLLPYAKEPIFGDFKDCIDDMTNILEKEAFIDGFRLGVKLIAESVYDKSGYI